MNYQLRHGAGDDADGVADDQLIISGIGKVHANGNQIGRLREIEMPVVLKWHAVLNPPAGK